jgi:hypothetical protein|tara:strand:- start:387 stop:497 length:111 start_codon:yes stop_codon:yes gene_type:complete
MVEVPVAETDEGTRRRPFEGRNVVSKAEATTQSSLS